MGEPLIENVDPLTIGETTYGEDIKGSSTLGLVKEPAISSASGAPSLVPQKKYPSRSKLEQIKVVEARKQKLSGVVK